MAVPVRAVFMSVAESTIRTVTRWHERPILTIRIHGTELLNPDRLESLGELIEELRDNDLDGQIIYRPPTGLGVTLQEVIALIIGGEVTRDIGKAALNTIVSRVENGALDWLKGKFRRSAEEGKTERKKRVVIYGPDGKPLKTIIANSVDDITVEDPEAKDS